MIKRLVISLALLISLLGVITWKKPASAQGICLTITTSTINGEVVQAVYSALENAPSLPVVDCFAITNVSQLSENRWLVSLSGLQGDLQDWSIQENADWFGMVAIQRHISGDLLSVLDGTDEFTQIIQEFPLDPEVKSALGSGGVVGASEYMEPDTPPGTAFFPFYNGTNAVYGILGIHNHGDNGWIAVDFLSNGGSGMFPNAVYAAQSGIITSVCRDDIGQMGMRIGNFYYTHLNDWDRWKEGMFVTLHMYLGSLKTGNFDGYCGGASQQTNTYHVHMAWPPSGNTLRMENWILNLDTEIWTYGTITRSAGQLIGPADWNGVYPPPPPVDPPDDPTPGPGGTTTPGPPTGPPTPGGGNDGTNFWTFLTNGIRDIAAGIASIFPDHESISLAASLSEYVTLPIKIVYITGVMNYRFAFILIAIIPIMEIVRAIYAIYMLIKRAIPVVG